MVCLSNADKITQGMLMAAMRLNLPVTRLDLVDARIKAGDQTVRDAGMTEVERSTRPTRPNFQARYARNY